MPRKKTLEEVKGSISRLTNGKIEILSTEYGGRKAPLLVKCSCGNEFSRSYDKLIAGYFLCPICANEKKSRNLRADKKYVLQTIENAGCRYISGEYINGKSVLTLQCKCGNVFQKRFNKFCAGQTRCYDCARAKMSDAKRKYDIDSAKEALSSYGYTLLAPEFNGAAAKHRCLCKNGHECDIILSQLLCGRSGCPICAKDAKKGDKHHNYNGGRAKIHELIRQSLDEWKKRIREFYGDQCPITGETGDQCVVHHLISLRSIFDDVSKNYGESVDLNGRLKDYSDYGIFDKIRTEVVLMHTLNTGILISRDVHLAFHKEYGKMDTTPEQFDEFLKKHYNTTLEKVQQLQESE